RPARDGSWIVPGQLRPDEISSTMGITIPEDSDYETLAGFVLKELGRIPEPGDQASTDDALIRVERMHGRRGERLRVVLRGTESDAFDAGGECLRAPLGWDRSGWSCSCWAAPSSSAPSSLWSRPSARRSNHVPPRARPRPRPRCTRWSTCR